MKLKGLFLALGATVVLSPCPQAVAGGQLPAGHVPGAVAGGQLQPLGRLAATNRLNLTIGLPLRNQPALATLLQQLYDPASTNYHHFLTPGQFTEKFGPTEEDYQAVVAFAKRSGFEVTGIHRNRHLLNVRASAATIEKALHVKLNEYRHPTESRTFFAPQNEPRLDATVPVLHISGLDDFIQPRPLGHPKSQAGANAAPQGPGSAPGGGFIGNDFRAAYLPDTTLTGSGQTIGLVELSAGFYTNDIINYEIQAGLPNVPITTVLLDGYTGAPGSYLYNGEVSLDMELAMAMAPGIAGIVVYEGTSSDDVIDEMASPSHGQPLSLQLSASWLYGTTPNTEQTFKQFAAQGQSFFNASGDSDAYYPPGSLTGVMGDTNITIVGGTTLATSSPGGSWQSEAVWNWGDGTGSSGGVSSYVMPPWQQGINMSTNQGSPTLRNVPDVAMVADGVFVISGNGDTGNWGGTSCATPLWAALTALVNQQAQAYGWPPAGFLNPALYALAQGPAYPLLFHDVTLGNNAYSGSHGLYPAVPGYDLCTGWGTPAGQNLIDTLAPPDHLVITPLNGFVAAGNPGGPFGVASQTLTLTNSGTTPIDWSVATAAPWLTVSVSANSPAPGVISLQNASFESPAGPQGSVAGRPDGWSAAYVTDWGVFNPSAGLYTNVVDDVLPSPAQGSQVLWIQAGNFISQYLTNTLVPCQTYTLSGAIGNRADSQGIWPGDQDCVYLLAGSTVLASNVNLPHPGPGSFLPWSISYASPAANLPSGTLEIRLGQLGASQVHYDNISLIATSGPSTTLVPGGSITVTVNLNDAAANFPPGSYTAAVWFTNQTESLGRVRTFTLNVLGAPTVSSQPRNQLVAAGNPATFTVGASGATPLSYSWCQNGAVIPDAIEATYILSNTPAAYSGSGFTCVVTNIYGAITSCPALLTVESPLYSFQGSDGNGPSAPLIQSADGNFYGTTEFGGAYGYGTVFRLTANGVLTTLVSFNSANGSRPVGGLAQAADGNLYGTTSEGGVNDWGTVFRLTTNGVLNTLMQFGGLAGASPEGDLILANDGFIYGTTAVGPYGTVFRVSTNGTVTTVAAFSSSGPNVPYAGLVQGNDGNFYGTTSAGGNFGVGAVFKMTPGGLLTTVASFPDGYANQPQPGLMQGRDGNFYGIRHTGGVNGAGSVFKVTPDGTLSTLMSFNTANGGYPAGGLVQDSDGILYGTTESGGTDNYGTVYWITTNGAWCGTMLTFDGVNGYDPRATLLFGADGNLYGTTRYGGALFNSTIPYSGDGTVFRITPTNPPTITEQPPDEIVQTGSTVSFACQVIGSSPLACQWQFQGTNLPGAASTTYTLANVTAANAGGYALVVTNIAGSATSRVAALTVVLPPGAIYVGGKPVVFYPSLAGFEHFLEMSSDPVSGLWVPVTNANVWQGVSLGGPETAFFRCNPNAVVAAAAGNGASAFIKVDGSLWAMGDNSSGQLGDGTYSATNRPEQIVAGGVAAVACGNFFELFLKNDGSLWGMGENDEGELGDGTYLGENRPELIVASNVVAIAAGNNHSLFLKSDGSLWAMGFNYYGQLGNGTTSHTNQPVQIVGSNVTAIAAGAGFSLFLKNDGSLWGMGDNTFGQLGAGPANGTNRPELIVAGQVTAIATGSSYSLFLEQDGSLWGMGFNYYGQLGDGTSLTVQPSPEPLSLTNVATVCCGYDHSLFLTRDASLWSTGYNFYGQLGDGTDNDTNQPELIPAGNVKAVAAGANHSLVVMGDGSLWATGQNSQGELGDGTYNQTNRLEQIVAPPVAPVATMVIGRYGNTPVILFPWATSPPSTWLFMTTNLASEIWVPATNNVSWFTAMQINNAPSPVYFRLK